MLEHFRKSLQDFENFSAFDKLQDHVNSMYQLLGPLKFMGGNVVIVWNLLKYQDLKFYVTNYWDRNEGCVLKYCYRVEFLYISRSLKFYVTN